MQPHKCMTIFRIGKILTRIKVKAHEMHETDVMPEFRIYLVWVKHRNREEMHWKKWCKLKKSSIWWLHAIVKLTLSGSISPRSTYGTGIAPQAAINISAENATTGIQLYGVTSIVVSSATYTNVAKMTWQMAVPANETTINSFLPKRSIKRLAVYEPINWMPPTVIADHPASIDEPASLKITPA